MAYLLRILLDMKGRWFSILLILAGLSTIAGVPAYAKSPSLWKLDQDVNSSYLRQTKNTQQKTILDDLLDSKRVIQARQQLQDMNRDYEMRRSFGVLTLQDRERHQSQIQGFGDSLFNEVRQYKERQGKEKLEKTRAYKDVEESAKENWFVGYPLGAAFMVYKVYFGHDMGFRLFKNTWNESRLLARMDGRGWMESKSVSGKLSLENRWLGTSAMNYSERAQMAKAEDKYWLTYERGIPLLDLKSSVGYGTETSLVTTEVRRPIMPHLDASVDTTRAAGGAANNAIYQRIQHRFQLKYGISF